MPAPPRPSDAGSTSPSRGFLAGCAALAAAIVVLCVVLARGEFFFGDDFGFLGQAQQPRDWLQVFFPLDGRAWWSYRPLSIEVYFSLLHRLVGLAPLPYLLVSLTLHFATGALAYRVARQLELERRGALAASVLSVAMYPSLNGELFWVSAFQTVSGSFFLVLTLTLFVDFLTRGRRIYQVAAAASMVLALASNELAMTLPGPIVLLAAYFAGGGVAARLRSALAASVPLIAILAVYLPFRYLVIGPSALPTPGLNLPHLGWHIPLNVVVFLDMLTKGSRALQIAMLALLVAGWAAALRAGADEAGLLSRRVLLLAGWLLCTMVPFLGAYFVPHRAAIVMETPFCLLLAAHLDPLVRAAASVRAQRLAEVGLLVLIIAAFPYAVVREQARAPRGAVNRELIELVRSATPALPFGACVRIQTRPGDTWSDGELFALSFRTRGVLAVAYPGLHLDTPVRAGHEPSWRPSCTARFAVELLHGPEASRPTFALRRAGAPLA